MAGIVLPILGALPDVVKAKAFHVVGKDGAVLVALGVMKSGEGVVTTKNGKGKHLVTFGVTEDGGEGAVALYNSKGQELVDLGVRTDGPGMVSTYDPRSIEAVGVLTTGL